MQHLQRLPATKQQKKMGFSFLNETTNRKKMYWCCLRDKATNIDFKLPSILWKAPSSTPTGSLVHTFPQDVIRQFSVLNTES